MCHDPYIPDARPYIFPSDHWLRRKNAALNWVPSSTMWSIGMLLMNMVSKTTLWLNRIYSAPTVSRKSCGFWEFFRQILQLSESLASSLRMPVCRTFDTALSSTYLMALMDGCPKPLYIRRRSASTLSKTVCPFKTIYWGRKIIQGEWVSASTYVEVDSLEADVQIVQQHISVGEDQRVLVFHQPEVHFY